LVSAYQDLAPVEIVSKNTQRSPKFCLGIKSSFFLFIH
jgi:hypothetical protein